MVLGYIAVTLTNTVDPDILRWMSTALPGSDVGSSWLSCVKPATGTSDDRLAFRLSAHPK